MAEPRMAKSLPAARNLAVFANLLGLAGIVIPVAMMLARADAGIDPRLIWYLSVIGLGVFLLGYFASHGAWRFGMATLSLFAGGGAQLWLTQPLWYPALTLNQISGLDGLMMAVIAAQSGVAMWILWPRLTPDRIFALVQSFGLGRILLFLLLSVIFSVSLMGFVPNAKYSSYVLHVAAAGVAITINLLSVLALSSLPAPITKFRGFHPILPAGLVLVASALLAWFAFERLPHVEDEVAYLFQAQTFAKGLRWVPAPPPAAWAGLEYYLLQIDAGNWFATTPPGWPAVLAVGVVLKTPWLVNPLLAALSVLLVHSIVTTLTGRNRAGLVTLFLCASPWFLATAASMMPHSSALFFMLLAWRLLLWQRSNAPSHLALAIFAGLCMGSVFVIRQLDGVLIGTLTGLWLLLKWRQPTGLARVIGYSVGCIAVGALFLIYNAVMTGDPLLPPLETYLAQLWQSGANAYGFGPTIGPPGGWGALDVAPGHGPIEALLITFHNIFYVHFEFLGWGIGSLALVWCLLLWGRLGQVDLMMLAIVAGVLVTLFFYWFSGSFYIGPRYWFSILVPLLVLSAGGVQAVMRRIESSGADPRSLGTAVFIMCLFGLTVFTPWRAVEKYHGYGRYSSDIRRTMQTGVFGTALVFFDQDANPGSALFLNRPQLPDDRPIFIRDLGADINSGVMSAFPDREVMYYSKGVVNSAN